MSVRAQTAAWFCSAGDIACTDQAVVPRGRIWRLSASAYKNAINDVLGYAGVDVSAAPLDSVTETKFSASAKQNVVNQPWADWFFAQGDKIGSELASAYQSATAAAASA